MTGMAASTPREGTPASGRPASTRRAKNLTIGAKKHGWRATPPPTPFTPPREPPGRRRRREPVCPVGMALPPCRSNFLSSTAFYDRRFVLTDTTTHEAFTLRVGITYVDSEEHLLIDLYSGNRRNNLSTWSTERPVSTRAHELGHQLGLKDEYVDPNVPDRADGTSPGVHTDHSIMGNHHSEGYEQAEAKQRHGEVIGGHIGAACGRTFSITTQTP